MNSSNFTNTTEVPAASFQPQFLQEPLGLMISRLIIEGIIFFVGVVGNILVCVVVVRENLTHSIAYVLILNLAIADLGILLLSFPFGLIRTEGVSWPFGWFGCKVLYPISDVFHGVSIGSITIIAVYRYRGIVAGRSPHPQRALKYARTVIASLWLFSFILLVTPLFFSMEFGEYQEKHYCYPKFADWLYFKLYQMELFILTYILPIVVIMYSYFKIRARLRESIELRRRIRKQSGLVLSKKDVFNERNFKALRVLAPVIVVFVVTMFPYNLYRVVEIFIDISRSSSVKYMLIFFKMVVLAFVCNSSANPVIYALMSGEFRKAFKWHLRYFLSKPLHKTKLFSLSERYTSIKKQPKGERKKSPTSMVIV
ncbi:hypothetical protein QZH41_003944 [Actinostola sp. cb2023]|nr:hypothetical protein QZH41_003944 [Actinostola sp. cb2023]